MEILSPIVPIPTVLEKMFVVVEHDLLSRGQLEEIARGIATEDGELPDGPELQTVLDPADLFEISRDERLPDDENWTEAEVKACCRLSALLDVPLVQAAQNVVPVAVTAAESVERLRA